MTAKFVEGFAFGLGATLAYLVIMGLVRLVAGA